MFYHITRAVYFLDGYFPGLSGWCCCTCIVRTRYFVFSSCTNTTTQA